MLKIHINDLDFLCIIGILPFERKKEQRVVINISFQYFFLDDRSNFIDYSNVVSFVQNSMINEKFELIEDAILYIRKNLKSQYEIENLKVKISKPDIISNCIVSVEE